jgi:hypothetical protein
MAFKLKVLVYSIKQVDILPVFYFSDRFFAGETEKTVDKWVNKGIMRGTL